MTLTPQRSVGLVLHNQRDRDQIESALVKSRVASVSWMATGTKEARTKFEENPVDVLIADVDLHDGNGLGLAVSLKNNNPSLGAVFLSNQPIHSLTIPVEMGASGRFARTSDVVGIAQLEREISLVAAAGITSHKRSTEQLISELTPRQLQVLTEVAHGFGNQAIAERLGIELSSVVNHLTAVYSTLSIPEEANPRVYATLMYYELH